MAKLRKIKLKKLICPTCKGNGFVKVSSFDYDEMIHQCWDCDSEGEFYETNNNLIGDDDSDRNHDIKLH
mgnify:FL=1|jgi:DnaJ-class molecular chaperone|tara:strand:- start:412 stop:618 length:207 start_codon:yes stop_codon:yes gene_type:complete